MQTRSFIIKVLLVYLLFIFLFIIGVFIFFFQILEKEAIANQLNHLKTYSSLMTKELQELWFKADPALYQTFVAEKALFSGCRITLISMTGVVLADSAEKAEYMDNHANRPEISKALQGESNYTVRFSNTLKKNMLYLATPIKIQNQIVLVLRISLYLDDIERLLRGLKSQYLIIISLLGLASAASILVIYFNFKKAIHHFSLVSQKVAEGSLSLPVLENNNYEIRELSASFANMIAKIKQLIGELKADKEELESILAAVNEGIAVIDEQGKIRRANTSFLKLFGLETARGRFYWEIIRIPAILDLLKKAEDGENRFCEVENNEKIILCSRSLLKERQEQILIFSDLTDLKKLENLKKEFVSNVSHELLTPLSTIQGYVETLLDEEKDKQKIRFLETIKKHSVRLSLIVKDLLLLSQLEEKADLLQLQPLDLAEVVSNILPLYEGKLKAKGLLLTVEFSTGPFLIAGDAFRLEQAFINLLDNAYKYTEKGEIRITVSKDKGRVISVVKDTGIGIPAQDLEHIFERFYVVDKSRSREHGGTGLGLSIVKQIVLLHGGEIQVKSTLGLGSEFIMTFPLIDEGS